MNLQSWYVIFVNYRTYKNQNISHTYIEFPSKLRDGCGLQQIEKLLNVSPTVIQNNDLNFMEPLYLNLISFYC